MRYDKQRSSHWTLLQMVQTSLAHFSGFAAGISNFLTSRMLRELSLLSLLLFNSFRKRCLSLRLKVTRPGYRSKEKSRLAPFSNVSEAFYGDALSFLIVTSISFSRSFNSLICFSSSWFFSSTHGSSGSSSSIFSSSSPSFYSSLPPPPFNRLFFRCSFILLSIFSWASLTSFST